MRPLSAGLCALSFLAAPAQAPAVRVQASRVAQGGVLVLTAEGRGPLQARLGERVHPFFPRPGQEGRLAVAVPVPLDSPLGERTVAVEGAGAPVRVPFTVTPALARTLRVTVAPSKAELGAADQARAAREREEIQAIVATPGPVRTWSEPFRLPGGSVVTCGFGVKRTFNGVAQSVHRGIDFRAAPGTPVRAAGPGTVRLAKDLFFGGNLVFLDHGFGWFTSYAHLSRISVKPGQEVRAGELLGLSGATGRVSGPHLHWGASVGGVEVDPFLLRKAMAGLCGTPVRR